MTGNMMFLPRAEIEAIQERNFAATMDLVAERHPYYRGVLARLGLARSDFGALDDLARLPGTTKGDYMAAPEDFRLDTAGLEPEMQAPWDVMHTTGTTAGRPTPFYSTTWDFFDILALQRAMLALRGVGEGDVIANLFPLTVWPHGGFTRALHAAAVMNVPVVSPMPGNPSPHFRWGRGLDEVVDTIARTRATILWGVPSYIRRVLIRAVERGVDLSPVRLVFVTGEATPEGLRGDLAARLQALGAREPFVSISYGATEMQGGMVECAPGSGYHNPAPDQFRVDIVDPETHAPVSDGERGLVLLTHLRRRGTVLLRYALGDVTRRVREPCAHCGANTDRLIETPTRADSLIKIKGMLVNPDLIVDALAADPRIAEFQVVLAKEDSTDRHAMDSLTLRLALADNASGDSETDRIARGIKQVIGITPTIELARRDDIYRPGESLKSKRVVDLRSTGARPSRRSE